ncbi:unnamed protein product [Lepidochelys olivacea]
MSTELSPAGARADIGCFGDVTKKARISGACHLSKNLHPILLFLLSLSLTLFCIRILQTTIHHHPSPTLYTYNPRKKLCKHLELDSLHLEGLCVVSRACRREPLAAAFQLRERDTLASPPAPTRPETNTSHLPFVSFWF